MMMRLRRLLRPDSRSDRPDPKKDTIVVQGMGVGGGVGGGRNSKAGGVAYKNWKRTCGQHRNSKSNDKDLRLLEFASYKVLGECESVRQGILSFFFFFFFVFFFLQFIKNLHETIRFHIFYSPQQISFNSFYLNGMVLFYFPLRLFLYD